MLLGFHTGALPHYSLPSTFLPVQSGNWLWMQKRPLCCSSEAIVDGESLTFYLFILLLICLFYLGQASFSDVYITISRARAATLY